MYVHCTRIAENRFYQVDGNTNLYGTNYNSIPRISHKLINDIDVYRHIIVDLTHERFQCFIFGLITDYLQMTSPAVEGGC